MKNFIKYFINKNPILINTIEDKSPPISTNTFFLLALLNNSAEGKFLQIPINAHFSQGQLN